jgi:hypothetical protein
MSRTAQNELELGVIGSFVAVAAYAAGSVAVLPALPVVASVAMFGAGLSMWLGRKGR